MKGVVFNLLEEFVRRAHGEDAWDALLARAALDGAYPGFFTPFASTRLFLLALNEIIHPEVNKLYRGADTPTFEFDATSDDVLVMGYASRRRLCEFAHGLIEGAAAHYGEAATIEQTRCMHQGDARCEFRIALGARR